MYFQYLFWIFIIFFVLSSVLHEGFNNCDNLVYQVGRNQQNFKKKII